LPLERLQKIISQAGIASRRHAEEMILEGRVRVNGQTVSTLGAKADLATDHIKVDGKLLHAPRHLLYLAMNKPHGVVTTMSDPQGRPTVTNYLQGIKERVYPVGRLDYHSEGLLLFTNDGDFANAIMNKRSNIVKTYVVKANGALSEKQIEEFRAGIPLFGIRTKPAGLKVLSRSANPWYEVQLTEGRQNQIRMMFKHFGFLVEKLKRVRIGFLELATLKPGQTRHLTREEVARFQQIFESCAPSKKSSARPAPSPSSDSAPTPPALASASPKPSKKSVTRSSPSTPRRKRFLAKRPTPRFSTFPAPSTSSTSSAAPTKPRKSPAKPSKSAPKRSGSNSASKTRKPRK
jgi:23S rRNA pseudouridine2605 synthase